MIREKFNDRWKVSKAGESPLMSAVNGQEEAEHFIHLPHDAMIRERRTKETKNKQQTGFYPGGSYTYTKKFDVPKEWEERTVLIEFEGVYRNALVYINGDYAGGHPYGYTNFYVSADDFLRYGQTNEIKVIANNSAEEDSRWYSGSGIYRDVSLLVGKRIHIKEDGVRIWTAETDDDGAVMQVETQIRNQTCGKKELLLITEILDEEGEVAGRDEIPITIYGQKEETCTQRIFIRKPKYWSCENPCLYTVNVRIAKKKAEEQKETVWDEAREQFGIRTLSLNSYTGLKINGQPIKLRGACIHHDNGIIGACTLKRAEERRIQQLKNAGFNCVRSAHHPMSKAMLEACDKEGMLVLDELADCWTRPKNNNDYSQIFQSSWEFDVEQMIAKDFNHPSVIMYIPGNEIQEAGTGKGCELNRKIVNKIRSLDSTRYTCSAINGLLAGMDRMGEIMCQITGMTPEQMMEMQANAAAQESSDAGSDAVNNAASLLLGPLADAFACSPIMTEILNEFASVTDVAGYNYLTARHEMEHEMNPNRTILGTETFPADIVRLWKIAEENTHVIGDMTWTGYDYLGEAGAGIFYYDGRMGFGENWPSSIAYLGDIDIIGYRRPMSYFREIVYGIRKDPYIAVERLNRYGQKATQSAWIWKDEIASWTWNGYEGKPAVINVYAGSEEVELFLNGKSLGKKPSGKDHGFMASFETEYQPGRLEAAAYEQGERVGKWELCTAEGIVELCVETDRTVLKADGEDLAYITLSLRDKDGHLNMQAVKEVHIDVEGAGTLQGFGSADPETENHYDEITWKTYEGYLLAVIRAGENAGEIKVRFTAEDCEARHVVLRVEG